jgi:exosortase
MEVHCAPIENARNPSGTLGWVLIAVCAAAVWGQLVLKLTTDWSTNPQYEFGFFVPFFVFYLLSRRWADRPPPSARLSGLTAIAIGLPGLLALLPIRIIQEANPDWRPLNWVHAALVVALSLVPIAHAGGWRWVRHFGFPLCFIFLALPWPLATEQSVLQAMSHAVTAVTVELLNLLNVPALQRGNVIDIAAGSVGIADACSGIRSLAGTVMASVFFGEFYRLTVGRRLLLLAGGTIAAFALNLGRTFFLGWRAAKDGIESIQSWHDPAGYTIFLISFAALWLIAILLDRTQEASDAPVADQPFLICASPILLAAIVVWVLAIEALNEGWYRYREGRRPPAFAWEVQWPEEGATFRFTPIPDEARSILRYSSGKSALFDWSDGSVWHLFFFRWDPGRSSAQLAVMHRPEICLPAVGYKIVAPAAPVDVTLGNVKLPFTGTTFDCNGTTVYVFRCLWEDQSVSGMARARNFDMSVRGRVTSAWYGRRNLGQRLLQVGIAGTRDEQAARDELLRRLPALIAVAP